MATATDVGAVGLVGVGLALEADLAVGFHVVKAIGEQTVKPLKDVNNVEEYVAELSDLGGVYPLVVQNLRC